MSDLKGKILMALDAIHSMELHFELVKMASEQMDNPIPERLDRVCLLLSLFQENFEEMYETSKTSLIQALEEATKTD